MKVTLVEFTGKNTADPARYAAAMLAFAKATRLEMSPGLFDEILAWPQDRLDDEIAYIANTIPSSHEFVDYTFMICGVSRSFTHQFVRTRTASFAQQTMRVLDVSAGPGWDYATGKSITASDDLTKIYEDGMRKTAGIYKFLIKAGASIEDARGVLPTNILTNILVKMNMRTLVDLVRKRSSPRVQGEYRDVLAAMKAEALKVHPWLELFIERDFDKAAQDLDAEIAQMTDRAQATRMMKLVDQMRSQS